MTTPEQRAGHNIDRLLQAVGGVVQDRSALNLGAGPGVAAREYHLSTGPADYLHFVQRKAIGMVEPTPVWSPRYTITPAIARGLMEIEAARAVVERTPLPPTAEAELRRRARLCSTHYSTRIEGNRLSLAEAERVIGEAGATVQGRARDVREVRNYWHGLLRVEE